MTTDTARDTVIAAVRAAAHPDELEIVKLDANDAVLVVFILDDDTQTHRRVFTAADRQRAGELIADVTATYTPEYVISLDAPLSACVAAVTADALNYEVAGDLGPFDEQHISFA